MQFRRWDDDLVRCELSSNYYLADEHLLDAEAVGSLTAAG